MLNNVERWMWPNRAADPTKATILQDSWPLISHYWEGSRKEGWYLDLCAVHPEFQGKGCGRELVEWGVDAAAREGVVASVISAAGKERFYGRFGFVEVGRSNVGTMSVLEGGAIMFNDVKV
jgi:GNAT superfamily N-acetyltransferase